MTNETTSPVEVTEADLDEARRFVADEWPTWDTDQATVCAELAVRFARHRIASRATDTALAEEVVDSGMSAKAVERAEWLWANLPTGRKWTSLATHEKALVCHTLAVLEGART